MLDAVGNTALTILVLGVAIGLYLGVKIGRWVGFFQLGQWEMKQRLWRARRWRRGY